MNLLLAQAPPAHVLIRGDDASTSSGAWLAWAAGGVVVVLVVAALLAAWWRRPVPEPTPRVAYRVLMRRMGLGRGSRGLLADLAAAHGSASPLALIGSASAFAGAVRKLGGLSPTRARTLRRLERRLSRERSRNLTPR